MQTQSRARGCSRNYYKNQFDCEQRLKVVGMKSNKKNFTTKITEKYKKFNILTYFYRKGVAKLRLQIDTRHYFFIKTNILHKRSEDIHKMDLIPWGISLFVHARFVFTLFNRFNYYINILHYKFKCYINNYFSANVLFY